MSNTNTFTASFENAKRERVTYEARDRMEAQRWLNFNVDYTWPGTARIVENNS